MRSWSGPRVAILALALILALGLGLRLHAALDPSKAGPDSQSYDRVAKVLVEDHRYSNRTATTDWSPGAVFFYAGVYFAVGGHRPTAALIAVALVGAATILLVFLIARRLAGVWAGLIAALIAAVYPTFINYSSRLLSEPLAAFTLAAAVLAFLWAAERRRPWGFALAGLMIGLTAMIRPEYLPFGLVFALLCVLWLAPSRGVRAGGLAAGLVLAGFLVPIAPWTVRNYAVQHRFIPVSTGGGKVLYEGTYLPGGGDYFGVRALLRHRYGVEDMGVILFRVAKRYPDLPEDQALARIGRQNFSRFASAHPLDYAHMVARKMWDMWHRGAAPVMLHSVGWIALQLALLATALAGFVVLMRRRRFEGALLGTLLIGVTLTGGLLLAPERRNVPLMPLVIALAAAGAVWLVAMARRRAGYTVP